MKGHQREVIYCARYIFQNSCAILDILSRSSRSDSRYIMMFIFGKQDLCLAITAWYIPEHRQFHIHCGYSIVEKMWRQFFLLRQTLIAYMGSKGRLFTTTFIK